MLNFTNLSVRRGSRLLIADMNLTIHAHQKVGITGANGSGKSSLLALVRGELQPDAGTLTLPPRLVMAHVAQETPAGEMPAIDYILEGDAELAHLLLELDIAERAEDGARQGALHVRIDEIDGYSARARAARLLHGLGFNAGSHENPVASFSGGWRMRLNLARALMCRSDILLLDEPTNHLDLDAIIWLENWLRGYPGTLLLISHDRDFLDRVVAQILHVESSGNGGSAELYSGNYTAFETYRAAEITRRQADSARQQREIKRMRSFVDRFRAKATKARQAQSRLKALARMELIAPVYLDSPFQFEFLVPEKLPNPLLRLEKAAAGYGDIPVLRDVEFGISPGDRIGLLGQNGAGKSTLIKLLAGIVPLAAGQRQPARDLRVGYFAQHQLDQLRSDDNALVHLQRLDRAAREQNLRDFLGRFGFGGDRITESIASFSGGEKARLALALLLYQRPNLVLLDEPTNHLDLAMRHALATALQGFEGAMVLVSHDRHLLRTVTDTLLVVADGTVTAFDGTLDDYPGWLEARSGNASDLQTAAAGERAPGRKEKRRNDALRRKQLQPLRDRLRQLEQSLDRLARDQERLAGELAAPNLYDDAQRDRLKKLLIDKGRADQALTAAEETWLAASEELQAAERTSDPEDD
ncbi:MAG: ATP-binding cassette domain-containing protein [Acidiferrobacterales bacterium]